MTTHKEDKASDRETSPTRVVPKTKDSAETTNTQHREAFAALLALAARADKT